jgi:hypothetical protein
MKKLNVPYQVTDIDKINWQHVFDNIEDVPMDFLTTFTNIIDWEKFAKWGKFNIKEFFSKEPIKQKIKNIMKLAVVGLGVIICLGRVHMLFPNNLMQELELIQTKYASKEVTKVEALTSYTNMVEGSLLTVSSKVNKKYIWTGILDEISYIGVAIFIIMLIGIIKDRKDKFTQICSIWLIFSILLLTVLNWSVHESPLFSIYFSWAFIPLFVKGLDYLIKKFNIKEKNVYYPIIGIVGIINIINMINIFMFFN